ncbi:MAG TPA: hypothetical protein VGE27_05990 [Gemmatimonas sp.]|uniref:hypothetical protein n=1 Tax=Gemmatimonas sp. TaxID=1962908 RepID=UPI002ED98D5A
MKKVTEVAVLASTLVGLVLGFFAIAKELRATGEPKLKAVATFHRSALSPEFLNAVKGSLFLDSQRRQSLNALLARDGIVGDISSDELPQINEYWQFEIANEGSAVLKNVRLTVPQSTEARFQHEGEPAKHRTVSGVLELGDLSPGARATANVWVVVGRSPERVDFRIAHDEGIGSVDVLLPTGRIGQFAELLLTPPTLYFVLVALLFPAISSGVAALGYRSSYRKTKAKLASQDESARQIPPNPLP